MKTILLTLLALFLSAQLYAQLEMSAFTATGRGGVATTFATDYQAIGINAANLGFRRSFRDPKITLGFLEANMIVSVEKLERQDLFGAIIGGKANFTYDEKVKAAEALANTNFAVNLDIMSVGMGVNMGKAGGFAFSVRDRIQSHVKLSARSAELAFLGAFSSDFGSLVLSDGNIIANPRSTGGAPLSKDTLDMVVGGIYDTTAIDKGLSYGAILDGTRISASWLREYNFSYGLPIVKTYNLSMYAGAGARYITGFTLIDIQGQNGELTYSQAAISPSFGLNFGDSANVSAPSLQPSSGKNLIFPKSVGTGLGIDFGLTFVIRERLYIGMAANNIGSLNWDGNVYDFSTSGKLVQFSGVGFDSYNVFAPGEGAFQFAGDKSPFKWKNQEAKNVQLPSTYRFGASYDFYGRFHVGFDLMMPLNDVAGNIKSPIYAIGGDFRPNKVFKISTGLSAGGNNSRTNFPIGITYMARRGFYEIGIATRDITSYFVNVGNGTTISLATGVMRFKF